MLNRLLWSRCTQGQGSGLDTDPKQARRKNDVKKKQAEEDKKKCKADKAVTCRFRPYSMEFQTPDNGAMDEERLQLVCCATLDSWFLISHNRVPMVQMEFRG